ncbi:nitrogenase component 1 [Geobacter sp. SVR]|uniref:nitrogenase component 1 n=1 Tax=Geobacter sp. SVR TaxID=2495594 RepID=UPI00143F0122|nr:nitrogenase component 1 [Geobacter sp. SVR]BCS53624.1 hydrogenase [Geobacter sp. SVR]GCF84179.1 hydrogenase [Geobacter sp. SVR]
MAQIIDQVRHVCTLGGLQSVLAIDRAIPILHAGPGCGQKLWGAVGLQNGGQGSGYAGGHTVPCTNATERDVVFGATDKLHEVVENTFKVIDADFFAVLTGCTSDIVGDDVGDVVRRFQKQGKPIVWAETGGFKGSNFIGHELVLEAIIDQYLKPGAETVRGLVNVWAVVPYQDPFWTGVYAELGELLTATGLTPNIIFGPRGGVAALDRVPTAQFNLLVSPWVGLKAVQRLEEKFDTPFLHSPVLPIGPTETGKFLRALAGFADLDAKRVEAYIAEREDHYYHFIERAAEVLLETRFLPRHFTTITDSAYGLGLAKFLVSDLGLIPDRLYVTDGIPDHLQAGVAGYFKDLGEGIGAEVTFTPDGGQVQSELRATKFRSRPLILGSSWERPLAKDLNGFALSVSMPVSDRLVFDRSYVGYTGALRLVEDIYSAILSDFQ